VWKASRCDDPRSITNYSHRTCSYLINLNASQSNCMNLPTRIYLSPPNSPHGNPQSLESMHTEWVSQVVRKVSGEKPIPLTLKCNSPCHLSRTQRTHWAKPATSNAVAAAFGATSASFQRCVICNLHPLLHVSGKYFEINKLYSHGRQTYVNP
jgi:hypothetical protein